MQLRLLPLLCLSLALLTPSLRATSVVPPTFPELVEEADAIYRAKVTAIEPRRVAQPNGATVIKTFVTFAVDRVLKGPAQTHVTLEFLGGTIGNERLEVSGMPTFALGQREFVFVQKNGIQFCPLVGMMHGRYRLQHDDETGRDFIERDNGMPLTDPAEVGLPMTQQPTPFRAASADSARSRALTPAAFEASIVSQIQRLKADARDN